VTNAIATHLQEQLATAQAAIAAAEVRLGEEQEGRREFLRQFQAKSKAALTERVELEQQASQLAGYTTRSRLSPDGSAIDGNNCHDAAELYQGSSLDWPVMSFYCTSVRIPVWMTHMKPITTVLRPLPAAGCHCTSAVPDTLFQPGCLGHGCCECSWRRQMVSWKQQGHSSTRQTPCAASCRQHR
jgi:hypothetical protein